MSPPPPPLPSSSQPSVNREPVNFPSHLQDQLPESLVDDSPAASPAPPHPPMATASATSTFPTSSSTRLNSNSPRKSASDVVASASSSSWAASTIVSRTNPDINSTSAKRRESLQLKHLVLFDAVENESAVDEDGQEMEVEGEEEEEKEKEYQVVEDEEVKANERKVSVVVIREDGDSVFPSTTTTMKTPTTTTMKTTKRIKLTSELSLPRDEDADLEGDELTTFWGGESFGIDGRGAGGDGSESPGIDETFRIREGNSELSFGEGEGRRGAFDEGFSGKAENTSEDSDPLTKLVVVTATSNVRTAATVVAGVTAAEELTTRDAARTTSNSSSEVTLMPQTASSDC